MSKISIILAKYRRYYRFCDADGVNDNRHEGLEHLDEGDGEEDVGGIGESEGKDVEGAGGDDRLEIEVTGDTDGADEAKDADEEEGEGGAEGNGVEGADGDDKLEVEVTGDGDGADEAEDADKEEGKGGAEGHVGERSRD
ncbi:uncharacterized protein [Malus domestica]|uniref:uncharacterized protein n=1 Tax=Malus domestica TaxID=3750 RepID=UPI00397666CC